MKPNLKPFLIVAGFIVGIVSLVTAIDILTTFDYSTLNLFALLGELLYPLGFLFVSGAAIIVGMNYDK